MGWKKTLANTVRKYVLLAFGSQRYPKVVRSLFDMPNDFCGPLKTTESGNKYILNIVFRFTRQSCLTLDVADQSVTSPEGLSLQAMEHDFQSPVAVDDDVHDEAMDTTSSHSDNKTNAPPSPDQTQVSDTVGGAQLEAAHLELPFPDRLDLHAIQLDQYGINIRTVRFQNSTIVAPVSVEEASLPRRPSVWRVARQYGTFKLCMQGHRALVTSNKNCFRDANDFEEVTDNSFIVASFRARQIDYMRFAFTPKNARGLYALMADIQYFLSAPPVPGNIRLITNIYRDMIKSKLTNFKLFESRPQEVMRFLQPIYSKTCGAIAASATEASDHRVYNVIWATPDIGRFVEGAYQADTLRSRIVHLAVDDSHIRVTAELILKDTARFRAYMLSTPHKRMAVGTALYTVDDRSNPVWQCSKIVKWRVFSNQIRRLGKLRERF
ncbi:unnamed protein product [Heligmosomoides polygyrus]|uniref:Tim44 domain-containing protein n=1 Tax=Heligmosomoides polygyrus TaxID=6339 RepID=A0A183G4D8_HELPZ|nr:unnamed protein product [Heligmosomoides polygyrus]